MGVFLLLFAVFHVAGALYVSSFESKSTASLRNGVAVDLQYLKEQGDEVAKDDLLISKIEQKDPAGLLALLQQEKANRSIGIISVANAAGVVMGRTSDPSNLGVNAFLISPQGRAIAQGKSAEGIIEGLTNPSQLILTTGRPINKDGQLTGGLFASDLMDDSYAIRFKNTYLPPGSEVVFYTKDFGVYGDSFSDPQVRKLVNSYFSSGSQWVQNGLSDRTIFFKKGVFYLVGNVVFPGSDKTPGGALIFTPRQDFSEIANVIIGFLTLSIFIFLALRYHWHSRGEERGWKYYLLLFGLSILVLEVSLFSLTLQRTGYLKLENIPYPLYNSTVRLQPEFGIFDVDFPERFSVVVDTGDEEINAVRLGLVFDPEAVQVKELTMSKNSTCAYVIENTIDASAGRASFACAITKSGGERGSLSIVDVSVIPKRTGSFTLAFDEKETQVLANDGLGTNVLRMSQSGNYRVDQFDPSLFDDTSTATAADRSFIVFSPTHPNQSRWYNSNVARFVWRGKLGGVYKYEFDTSPHTVPSTLQAVQGSEVVLPIPGDGVFYFHLQLASGGPIADYRIQADQTPPSIVSIHLSQEKIIAGDVVRVSFDAADAGSGIQNNYYVDLGSHLFLPAGSELYIPFIDAGDQKLVIRVYDNAGNYSEKSQTIHVENP
jgi:hypothetical protein